MISLYSSAALHVLSSGEKINDLKKNQDFFVFS